MSLVYANGLLLLMVLIELAIFHFKMKKKIFWREVVFNLNSGHILMWVLRGMEISAFHFVSIQWGFPLLEGWSYPLIWIFAFFTWDFCFIGFTGSITNFIFCGPYMWFITKVNILTCP